MWHHDSEARERVPPQEKILDDAQSSSGHSKVYAWPSRSKVRKDFFLEINDFGSRVLKVPGGKNLSQNLARLENVV